MVTKQKSSDERKKKKGRVQVGKLSLNRETIKDLSPEEKSRIKGAAVEKKTIAIGCIVETVATCMFCR